MTVNQWRVHLNHYLLNQQCLISTPTGIRTQNAPLEAEYDFHFTIEANNQRKARDSNPYLLYQKRLISNEFRPTVSGCLPAPSAREERVESSE